MKLNTYLGFLLLSALPISAMAQFQNGSFEDPAIANGTIAFYTGNSLPGWTSTGAFGNCVITNGYTVGSGTTWHSTPSGNQYLYINPYTAPDYSVSQTVSLGAGTQRINFLQADFAGTYNIPGGEVVVSVVGPSSQGYLNEEFTTAAFSSFIEQSGTFDAPTAGQYTVTFTSLANHAAIIDDVSIQATPEPATALALPAGLGLLALRSRRRRASRLG